MTTRLAISTPNRNRYLTVIMIMLLALLFTACLKPGDGGSSKSVVAPTNVTVTAGDGRVTISWSSNVTINNLYFASEPGVNKDNYAAKSGGTRRQGVTSPYTVTGLRNGTTYYFVVTALEPPRESEASSEVSAAPAAIGGGAFDPTGDTTLPGGDHTFTTLNIRQGVTVTLLDDVVIHVSGDAVIDGTLTGDCTATELRVAGSLSMDGLIDNACSAPSGASADLKVVADGELTIGTTPASEEAIVTDGFLTIVDSATENDPLTPAQEFDSVAQMISASAAASPARVTPQAGGRGRLNRPVRARRGANVRRNGDLDVNAGVSVAKDGKDSPDMGPVANCDNSNNIGGAGGSVYLASRNGTLTIGGNLTAGNGGRGGDCLDNLKNVQAPASAKAGNGGRGGGVYVGGVTIRFVGAVVVKRGNGGDGGKAIAAGADGLKACDPGQPATAVGGNGGRGGGIGYLYFSPPPNIVGAPTEAGSKGGRGGDATATGGDANPQCGNGAGGQGGDADATGGQGGDGASAEIWPVAGGHTSGDGGDARAFAGDGGNGEKACRPIPGMGGDGGKGGNATASGGQPGKKGKGLGMIGKVFFAVAGDGGDGGEGIPPGMRGAKGIAVAAGRNPNPVKLDGLDGRDGAWCPLGFFLFAADLPAGEVTPGSYQLAVVEADKQTFTESTITTVVRSDGARYLIEDGHLFISEGGGLEFNFDKVAGVVTSFRVSLDETCSGQGLIQLRGLVDNEVVVTQVLDLEPGDNVLQIDFPEGLDDVYLEAIGTAACLGPWAIELAIANVL